MKDVLRRPPLVATAFLVIVVAAVLVTASLLGDPELINRAGASLSAIGAALVIYQAFIEARFERSQKLESRVRENLSPANLELAIKILKDRSEKRKSERIEIVAAIAIIVFVGEIMHGWGEYLYLGQKELSEHHDDCRH